MENDPYSEKGISLQQLRKIVSELEQFVAEYRKLKHELKIPARLLDLPDYRCN
jgi:hypothetical protein